MPASRPLPVPRAGLAALLLLAACAGEPTAPGAGGSSRSAELAPRVRYSPQALQAGNLVVDEVRLAAFARGGDFPIAESRVPFPAGAPTVQARLNVPLRSNPDTLIVVIDLLGGGQVLFSGSQLTELRAGGAAAAPVVELFYLGPGTSLRFLSIEPQSLTMFVGDTTELTVRASDGAGLDVPLFYANWSASDPAITVNENGRVIAVAPTAGDGVVVTVNAPNDVDGASASAPVFVLPRPGALTITGGDGQTGAPTDTLPIPLAVRVTNADGTSARFVPVTFRATAGGGTVLFNPVFTDTGGVARATVALGAANGANTFVAEIAGLTATFNLTAATPNNILFVGDTGAALLPHVYSALPNGPPVRVQPTSGLAEAFPRWSPSRRFYAYHAPLDFATGQGGALFVASRSGSSLTSVVADTPAFRPRWNRQGTRFAFAIGSLFSAETGASVCVVNAGVSDAGPITPGAGNFAGRTCLTDDAAFRGRPFGTGSFAWDPVSGDSVVFARDTTAVNTNGSALYVADAATGGFRRVGPAMLAVGADTLLVRQVEWSETGAFFVVSAVTQPAFQRALFRVSRDGSQVTRLTSPGADEQDLNPSISPDGSQVAFLRLVAPDGFIAGDYFRVPAGGGAPTQVSSEGSTFGNLRSINESLFRIDWSPAGQDLVLVGTFGPATPTVYRVPATTTSGTYLTQRVGVGRVAGTVRDLAPSWRP